MKICKNPPINQNENTSNQLNEEKPIENKEPIIPVDKTRLDSLKTKVNTLQDDEIRDYLSEEKLQERTHGSWKIVKSFFE